MEQRVGQAQSIMNKIVEETIAGARIFKIIHTPTLG
jgi:hypothetical protein